MNLQTKQRQDSDIEPVLGWKLDNRRPLGKDVSMLSPASRHYWSSWEALELKQGVRHKKFYRHDGRGSHLQLLVSKCLQQEVLKQMHDGLLAGHLGRKKAWERLLQRYYWFGVCEDTDLWVARCDKCAMVKAGGKKARGPLG